MAFVGYDIGSTHMKFLVLDKGGKIIEVEIKSTPIIEKSNVFYFSLPDIEHFIFNSMYTLKNKYYIEGISITSIGESVVPISKGKALAFPLLWDSPCTKSVVSELSECIRDYTIYENIGTCGDYTFSIYKIYWMKNSLNLINVDYWLPLSSYLNYLLTGVVIWCESHACRSLLYDIHQHSWIEPLLKCVGIEKSALGDIGYTGAIIGKTKDGIVVVLSGHDHITGLFGLQKINEHQSFVFQSMGTSSVLATVAKEKNGELHFKEPFTKNGKGKIGTAFATKQFFLQNSFRYFGKILKDMLSFCGYTNNIDSINYINDLLHDSVLPENIAIFMFENDPFLLSDTYDTFPIIHMSSTNTKLEMFQSLYVYLAIASNFALNDLTPFINKYFRYYVGGGFSENILFLKYLSSAINQPIFKLKTPEVSALGAAISSVYGVNKNLIKDFTSGIEYTCVYPDDAIVKKMYIYKSIYQKWIYG